MRLIRFDSEKAFLSWHDAKCAEVGIPHPGFNAATGEVAIDAQWTTAHVDPVILDGAWCISVDDDVRLKDPILAKLEVIEVKDPADDEVPTFATVKAEQALPLTWVDKAVEYAVAESKRQGRSVPKSEADPAVLAVDAVANPPAVDAAPLSSPDK